MICSVFLMFLVIMWNAHAKLSGQAHCRDPFNHTGLVSHHFNGECLAYQAELDHSALIILPTELRVAQKVVILKSFTFDVAPLPTDIDKGLSMRVVAEVAGLQVLSASF